MDPTVAAVGIGGALMMFALFAVLIYMWSLDKQVRECVASDVMPRPGDDNDRADDLRERLRLVAAPAPKADSTDAATTGTSLIPPPQTTSHDDERRARLLRMIRETQSRS